MPVPAPSSRRRWPTAAAYQTSSGEPPSLRRLLIDLLEEYARHVGHADVIRESVDGLVREDPPGLTGPEPLARSGTRA